MRAFTLGLFTAAALSAPAFGQIVTGIQTASDNTGKVTITTTESAGASADDTVAKARADQIAAATAAVPGSGIAPTTTANTGAGTEEGNLIAAISAKVAARYIHHKISDDHLLIFVGAAASAPDVSAWLFFDNQTTRLRALMEAHNKQLDDIVHPGGASHLLFTGAELAVAKNLLSYGYTSYSVSGAALTADDYLLDVALLQYDSSHTWRLFNQSPNITLPTEISTKLSELDKDATDASKLILEAQGMYGDLTSDANKAKPGNAGKAAQLNSAIMTLAGDVTNYNAFLTTLSGTGSVNWSAVLQAHAIDDALTSGKGNGIVFVKLHSASLGVITKSNLFTNFGAMPLYTSAGLVVSYVYYAAQQLTIPVKGKDGKMHDEIAPLNITAANVFEVVTPYNKAGHALDTLRLGEQCDFTLPTKNSENDKYCPRIFEQ